MPAPGRFPRVGGVPAGKGRVSLFIAGLLLVQLLLPWRYYLGDDPYDERFSWRMFSAVWATECGVRATEDTTQGVRTVQLKETLHEAWVSLMAKNREAVIRSLMERRCQDEDVLRVDVINSCVSADGEGVPQIRWSRECRSGQVIEPDVYEDAFS